MSTITATVTTTNHTTDNPQHCREGEDSRDYKRYTATIYRNNTVLASWEGDIFENYDVHACLKSLIYSRTLVSTRSDYGENENDEYTQALRALRDAGIPDEYMQ
jgi:hypothetical protein